MHARGKWRHRDPGALLSSSRRALENYAITTPQRSRPGRPVPAAGHEHPVTGQESGGIGSCGQGPPLRIASLGQFATGVTIVTAGGEMPCGMTANSFTSVSLDPARILVCVTRDSEGLQGRAQGRPLRRVGALAVHQEDVARYFADPLAAARRGGVRHGSTGRRGRAPGHPGLDDAIAWLDCALVTSHDGGDHEIFIGSVRQRLRTGR